MPSDESKPAAPTGVDPAFRAFMDALISEIREHGHAVSGHYVGRDALVLTTLGARSGLPRSNPVAFTRDGERFIISATNDGAETHPAWYGNLLADPRVTVEVDRRRLAGVARVATGAERVRLWQRHVANHPGLAGYPGKTTRRIPVVVLELLGPLDPAAD